MRSLVEGEHPVEHAAPPGGDGGYAPEAAMVLEGPPHYVLVSAVAEGGVGAHLAVAELVVPALRNVEVNRPAPGDKPFALPVAEGTYLGVATSTPLVDLSSVQVDVRWVDTLISRHAWRPVSALLVRSALVEMNNLLLWEVCDIVHRHLFPWSWRLHHDGCGGHDVSLVGLHLGAGGAGGAEKISYDQNDDNSRKKFDIGLQLTQYWCSS